jgi:hypothetical protein
LGDPLAALAAVHATRRRPGPTTVPGWLLIVALTGGRLLARMPGS